MAATEVTWGPRAVGSAGLDSGMPYAEANGIRLYYELLGKGPPLALVEGLGYASWMWFRQAAPLAAHHRLLVYDNRDVGQSDKPGAHYTIRDMADDLAALLSALGIPHTHLMGVSMGGLVAQEFALAYPDRLEKLVLVGTHFGGPEMVPIPPETQALMVPDISLSPVERIRKAMAVAFAPGYAEGHPEVIDTIVAMRLPSLQPHASWVRQAQAGARFDTSTRLGEIAAPTLVVHGDLDRVVPVENARMLAQRLPHAELLVLPGGGHLLFIEQADRFNRAVLDFLR